MSKALKGSTPAGQPRAEGIAYELPVVRSSILDAIASPFSRKARLRRRLAWAVVHPVDRTTTDRIRRAVESLNVQEAVSSTAPEVAVLIRPAFGFLCFCYTHLDEPNLAAKALKDLEKLRPPKPHALALRLDLLTRLIRHNPTHSLIPALLTPIVKDDASEHLHLSTQVLGALDCTYKTAGPAAVAIIIGQACVKFQDLPLVRSVLALCNCPLIFESVTAISRYEKTVDRACLSFSTAMTRDALIIAARASEYRRNFDEMREFAESAHKLDSNSIETQYWKCRAALHGDGSLNFQILNRETLSAADSWKRLFSAIELFKHPNINSVEPVIHILQSAKLILDYPETSLFLDLARKALAPSISSSVAEIRMRADLSERIRASIRQPLAWVTTNIAIDLLVDRIDYVRAWQELNKEECLSDILARELREVASVFVSTELELPKSSPCLEAVRAAMCVFFGEEATAAGPEQSADPRSRIKNVALALNGHVSDPLVQHIPGLRSVVAGLALALESASTAAEAPHQVTAILRNADVVRLNATSPEWLKWLLLRVRLLRGKWSIADEPPNSAPDGLTALTYALWAETYASIAVAERVRTWLSVSGHSSIVSVCRGLFSDVNPAAMQSKKESPPDRIGYNPIAASYRIQFSLNQGGSGQTLYLQQPQNIILDVLPPGKTESASASTGKKELFDFVHLPNREGAIGVALAADSEFADSFSKFKKSTKEEESSRAILTEALKQASSAPLATRMWWQPLISYWLAVNLATAGAKRKAASVFRDLLSGPKEFESRAQLALLAIQANDLVGAEQLLRNVPRDFPSVLYASALLEQRVGRLEEAVALISSYDERFGSDVKSYRQASIRLLAAIEERKGNLAHADQLLQSAFSMESRDPVAASRRLRIMARMAFEQAEGRAALDRTSLESLVEMAGQDGRASLCALLLQVLNGTGDMAQVASRCLAAGLSWRQLLIRRALQIGDYSGAVAFVDADPSVEPVSKLPAYFAKAQFVLRTWHSLRFSWQDPTAAREKFAGILDEASSTAFMSDPSVLPYVRAAAMAHSIATGSLEAVGSAANVLARSGGEQADPVNVALDCMASLQALLSEPSHERREECGARFRQKLDVVGPLLVPAQRALLSLLVAWFARADDAYLRAFSELGFQRDDQPVRNDSIWLGRSVILLGRSSFAAIVDGDMPERVADLSNADAALILAIAYSKLGAEQWRRGDIRAALQRVRLASRSLATLQERSPEIMGFEFPDQRPE